jgi:hypothetical protein
MNTSRTLVAIVLIALTSGCEQKSQPDKVDAGQAKAPASAASPAPLLSVTKWGPEFTAVGEVFNAQPSGLSALWFGISSISDLTAMEGWFGDSKLQEIAIDKNGGSFVVPTELISKPGKFPVYLVHTPSKKRYDIGTFTVLPPDTEIPTLKITQWGPDSTVKGEVFNKQANGLSAIWWQADGVVNPKAMEVWLGKQKLQEPSFLPNKGGTAFVPQSAITTVGKFPFYLVHKPSATKYEIGTFEVKAK